MERRSDMATRKQTRGQQPQDPLELKMDREQARAKLTDRIEKGRELAAREIRSEEQFKSTKDDYYKWDEFNNLLLKQMFTNDSMSSEYSFWVGGISYDTSLSREISELREDISSKCRRLDSIMERLELIPLEASAIAVSQSRNAASTKSNKVFIVHGHDEVAKTSLEVFVRENGLEPVVLHRQADQGQTIIEKFERHSEVGYAFILLTPDEVAYLAVDEGKPDSERKKEMRARPNVIFEFGYFVGKLGRSRVCCLHTGGVSLPSDISGMIYKAYNKSIEEVAYSILKDLKAAGYSLS
jgi:predicted nucleotide-binding protein